MTEPIIKLLPAGFFRWHAVIVWRDGPIITIDPTFRYQRAYEKAHRVAQAVGR